jgi:hypothetical protein
VVVSEIRRDVGALAPEPPEPSAVSPGRRALSGRAVVALGLVFIGVGATYWFLSYDAIGTTLLVALGVAMGFGLYALSVGSRNMR